MPPPQLPNVTRVMEITVLGVIFSETLDFGSHFDRVVKQAMQTMYALRVLRAHGLTGPLLWDVTQAVLLGKMMYAFVAWWGYAATKCRFEAIMKKAKKYQFLAADHML